MTEPVKGHNHDTAADLEADELRAQLRETQEEAEKYLASIEERQKELAALVDRCLLAESERDRWHKAFGEETLKHSAALRERDEARALAAKCDAEANKLDAESDKLAAELVDCEEARDAAAQRAEAAEARAATYREEREAERDRAEGLMAKYGEALARAESAEAALRVAREAGERWKFLASTALEQMRAGRRTDEMERELDAALAPKEGA